MGDRISHWSVHSSAFPILPAVIAANMATTITANDVLLYIPNLIGYFRVFCTLAGLLLMMAYPNLWLIATLLYVSSFVGDLFDGLVARKLNQTSEFGGLLDMVTDRCSTLGLLYVLGGEYSKVDEGIGFPVFRCVRAR
jgi:phosphatidylglycerophosphate synthase